MVMVMPETQTPTQTTTPKKKKTKKKEETQPTPTPTPTPKEPPKEITPKEAKKKTKETKEAKPPTQKEKAEAKPTTKPTPTRRLRIETIDWEKFEKFETKSTSQKKSWIQVVIEKAKKEPTKVTGLTRGRLMALITAVNRHNMNHEPKIMIKYDTKKGIALLAPITKQHFTKQ